MTRQPCPFCGCHGPFRYGKQFPDSTRIGVSIQCATCEATGPTAWLNLEPVGRERTPDELYAHAVRLWNQRAVTAETHLTP